jgi:predicted AAA+ superfamily ATPase
LGRPDASPPDGGSRQSLRIYVTNRRLNGKYTFMIERPCWVRCLREAWRKRPVVWVAGVRRVGKTMLARMLPGTTYMNCDLPSVVRRLEDP